jgi:hypothetical protein
VGPVACFSLEVPDTSAYYKPLNYPKGPYVALLWAGERWQRPLKQLAQRRAAGDKLTSPYLRPIEQFMKHIRRLGSAVRAFSRQTFIREDWLGRKEIIF